MPNPLACPKCQYERKASDNAPLSQCPNCGLIFSKHTDQSLKEAKYTSKTRLQSPHNKGDAAGNLAKFAIFTVFGIAFLILVFLVTIWIRGSDTAASGQPTSWIWLILLIPGIASIGYASQARSLRSKFDRLGILKGKSKSMIITAVGAPNSISVVGPNQTLLQWQIAGYHIAILFTGEVCDGISHEHIN